MTPHLHHWFTPSDFAPAKEAKECLSRPFRELANGLRGLHPAKLVFLGYFSYVVVGWILLSLPYAQKGGGVSALDNLFVATSAVSTTGLVTVSVSDNYTLLGQGVVLLLIQLGGIGYMTAGSFLLLSRRAELSSVREQVGRTVFSLPSSFRLNKFILSVIRFTLVIELLGAAALYALFRRAGVEGALWSAVFHSVSAFCTAGFSLNNDSFERFAGDFWVNAVLIALSYLGALGFIVCVDFWRKLRGKTGRITLTSKIILWTTFWMSAGGTALIFLTEPSIKGMAADDRLLAAFFQAMAAMTTVGFNTVDVGALSKGTLLLVVVLMVIGASPSGTGGGLKTTTFTAILGVMRSALHGESEVRFWGRPIPVERIWMACASLGFYLLALLVGTYLLELTEVTSFEKNLFEAASALGTVGLSMGITPGLTHLGKLIVTALMFCGRVGPLTFGAALFCKREEGAGEQDNDLAV